MAESNFSFVKNNILRQNLDEAFDHILTLLPFTESVTYNEPAKSAFRKTIIIYTASIIEALLFHILERDFTEEDIKIFYSSWEIKNQTVLYEVNETHKIVAGDYKKIHGKASKEKMNLAQICDFLYDKKVLSKQLCDKIDVIRNLRNEQHIGPHKKVVNYSKEELEKAFSIAGDVKEFVKSKC